MAELTPMMKQYFEIRNQNPGLILFFRLGDFYEMFREDAQEVSQLLGLTLTHRQGEPMCGIPYHSAPNYIRKLLDLGKKIAVCEQVSQPGQEKGIVRREVVEILTPATVVEENYLTTQEANFLSAVFPVKGQFSFSVLDTSTGEFKSCWLSGPQGMEKLQIELRKFNPKELLCPENLRETHADFFKWVTQSISIQINELPIWHFSSGACESILKKHFKVDSLKSFIAAHPDEICLSAGALLDYVKRFTRSNLDHVTAWKVYRESDSMTLDESAILNLELIRPLQNQQKEGSLYDAINFTKTGPGARKLKSWILNPLLDLSTIQARQSKVKLFFDYPQLTNSVRGELSGQMDLQRLCSKISLDKANPRDLLAVQKILEKILKLNTFIFDYQSQFVQSLAPFLPNFKNLSQELLNSIHPEPAISYTEGPVIAPGYNQELDRLRALKDHQEEVLEDYRKTEQETQGLSGLKLKFNRIIGYYFELTKSQLDKIPSHFKRKQSLLGSERFTTAKLESLEKEIATAEERILALEKDLFISQRLRVKEHLSALLAGADFLADTDVYQSLGFLAAQRNYTQPELLAEGNLEIVQGRHPVVEALLPFGSFIENTLQMDKDHRFSLITGPNMAGKSTYLRQNALIILLAQMGSFVPAARAQIPLMDRIFCRVGASDNLARGESTFMIEMTETAMILRNATEKSFVIMDEVGRGTSTTDGLAIAWAISEYLLDAVKCRTLFATHFHELTELKHPYLKNYSMAVEETGAEVLFLRKLIPQASDNSYGLYVAQLAGIPGPVLHRAKVLQDQLQMTNAAPGIPTPSPQINPVPQFELFSPQEMVIQTIKSLKTTQMTPLEALVLLDKLKKELET